jgi:hypothetical protein
VCFVAFLALSLSIMTLVPIPAFAGNIYDSNVERKLPLKGSQKSKVRKIVNQSDREMRKVFRKYGINPNRRPDFDKLRAASRELQAIEDREIQKMSKVLSASQFKRYKGLLEQTAARVRAAAQ